MIKKCTKCKLEKSIELFVIKNSRQNKYQSTCKECQAALSRNYYKNNAEKHKKKVAEINEQRMIEVKAFLLNEKSKPCKDCNISYPPYVMDFDHITDNKKYNVSNMIRKRFSIEKIKNEIQKCELVCSNCHRLRTFKKK